MRMRHHVLYKFLVPYLIICYLTGNGQTTTASLTLNSNTQGTHIARDEIKVLPPGGHVLYHANNGNGHLYLDKAVQLPATYMSAPPTINTLRSIDQGLKPGTIKGDYSVDLSGALNYNIPIQLPPGTNGMAPSIGISYNSNSGLGNMGMGWGISGLSAISRIPKTLFPDGVKSGIEFNLTGPFSLDGNRLAFQNTNSNGENVFYTENETFSQITLKNPNTQGQQYFEVKMKNGLTMIYGSNADSKGTLPFVGRAMPAVGGTTHWYLNRVIDNYGNYMDYTYYNSGSSTEGSDVAIKEITYTGNGSAFLVPYNSVKFFYDQRANPQSFYSNGDLIKKKLILREISVFSESSQIMPCFNYKFNYSQGAFDFLSEVIFSSNGESINSTVFVYGDPPSSQTNVYSASNLPLNADYSSTDLNGDGLSDLIAFLYNAVDPTYGTKTYYAFKVFINNGSVGSNQLFTLTQTVTEDFTFSNFTNTYLGLTSVKDAFLLADVIGDETPEIVYSERSGTNLNQIFVREFIRSTGQFQSVNYALQNFIIRNATVSNSESLSLSLGDFDADGKAELISFWKNNMGDYEFQYLDFNNGTSRLRNGSDPSQQQVFDVSNQPHLLTFYSSFSAVDFDGDGKSDLLGKLNNGVTIAFINIDFGPTSIALNEMYRSSISLSHSLGGDYNGDGYMDFAVESMSHLDMFYGTGINIGPANLIGSQRAVDVKRISMDIDNDGKSDLVELFSNPVNNQLHINTWKGSRPSDPFYNISMIPNCKTPPNKDDEKTANDDRDYDGTGNGDFYSTNTAEIPSYEVGDFNGDGNSDLLLKIIPIGGGVTEMKVIYFTELSDERYLTAINDGIGNTLKIDYFRLSNPSRMLTNTLPGCMGAGYSKSTTTPSYPLSNNTFPINVVGYVSDITDGPSNGLREAYYYTNAMSHLKGRGFLGFDKVVKKTRKYGSSLDVFQSTKEFDLDGTYFVRKPTLSKEEFLSPSGNKIFSTTTFNCGVHGYTTGSSSRYFFEISSQSTLNNYNNVTTIKNVSYDYQTGNLVQEITNIGPSREITQVDYNNFVNAGSWIANVPLDETTTVTKSGESPYVKNRSFTYDLAKGAILSTRNEPNAAKEILVTNAYQSLLGVLMQVTRSAPNDNPAPGQIVINYDYDSKFRFVEKVSSISSGYSTESKHEPVFGNKISTKSIDELFTLYTYDNFGKVVEVQSPDGAKTKYSYDWFNASALDLADPKPVSSTDAKFMSRVDYPDGKWEISVTDRFNRLLKTQSNTFNNGKRSNLAVYNVNGEVYKEFGPYVIPVPFGKAILEKTNTYRQDIGELSSQQVSDGNTNLVSSIQYNFDPTNKEISVTTTSPDNKTKTETTDATGRLIRVLDNNSGLLEYEYHYNGSNFVNVTKLNGTTVFTRKADNFNHPTEETEPNSGTKVFVANAFGQLKQLTDNKGTQTQFNYDILGRMTQKIVGPDYYNYIYYDAVPGKGQLAEINLNNANAYKYSYDNLGKPKKLEEFLDGNSFATTFEYDQLGRNIRENYANNFSITREYANGDLVRINNGQTNTLIWQLDELDNTGTISKYTLGNNLQTIDVYNNFGYQTQTQTGLVQDLSYNYNIANGNLNSVTDAITGTQENYVYDNLDRLKTINNSNYVGSKSITYDGAGNITTKYDAGNYTYHGTRVNQALTATNPLASSNPPDGINTYTQDVNYNLFDKATYISEGIYTADISYDARQERYKTMFRTSNTLTNTRYYLYGMERNLDASGAITDVNYIEAPTGLCAVQVTEPITGSTIHYTYSDFVGSIVAATDVNGNVEARQNFDPWGRRRDPITHDYLNISSVPTWLTRGYTGHEHLPQFTLINMNGRMYDPILSRMLSVDPILTDSKNSQDYNKYSYARNNPLKYTDPTGNFVVVGAIIFAGIAAAVVSSAAYSNQNPNSAQQTNYQSTYYSRVPMSGVNTGPGKNDVGDWTENVMYTYRTKDVWVDTKLRSKFDNKSIVYEKDGVIEGTLTEPSPGYWTTETEVSTYYTPGGTIPEGAWTALTKKDLLNYVATNECIGCGEGLLQHTTGIFFENLFEEHVKANNGFAGMRVMRATGKVQGGEDYTVPDYLGFAYEFTEGPLPTSFSMPSFYELESFADGYVELKATKNDIGKGSFDGQIKTQILAAQELKVKELIFVTTFGVKLTKPLLKFASDKGVMITLYWATYRMTNGTMETRYYRTR